MARPICVGLDYTSKFSLSFPGADDVEQTFRTPGGIEINETIKDEAHIGPLKSILVCSSPWNVLQNGASKCAERYLVILVEATPYFIPQRTKSTHVTVVVQLFTVTARCW